MKVLITGGTGFLGSNLALHYARQGNEVVVLSIEATPAERENAEDLRSAGVTLVTGSVTDRDAVAASSKGAAIVHHIAAAMREANVPDRHFWEVNVEATRHLLEVSRAQGVRRFVYCSSIGAMGKTPTKPADERTPCSPQDIYQVTKKAAEEACLEFHAATGLPISIVRPAEVYGPRDRRLLKLFRAIKSRTFVMIGEGRNEHHLVYIDDMVQGLVLAAEAEAAVGQIFIIAGERSVSLEELVAIIARRLGVPLRGIRVPMLPVRMLSAAIEDLCRPLGIQPPLHRRRIDFFRSDYSFDIGKARNLLGYDPHHDLERGVEDTLNWYRDRALL